MVNMKVQFSHAYLHEQHFAYTKKHGQHFKLHSQIILINST